jgi:sugar phosphate isomerase/epimerase
MRIGISNIAWDIEEDDAVASSLAKLGIDAIDIAPSKYFPDLAAALPQDFARVRKYWSERGVEITGMQALLFGTQGLNVFGDESRQTSLLTRLAHVFRAGAALGAPRLVFGSPKNRDRSGLSDERALADAVAFFRRAGALALDAGVTLCLEPNPARYGANFMLTCDDTAAVVNAVAHPAIRMQFDTGALTINAEDPNEMLRRYAPLIGHVHASEPDLVTLGDGPAHHEAFASALESALPHHVVTIEMTASKTEPHLAAIDRALGVARRHYGVTRSAA